MNRVVKMVSLAAAMACGLMGAISNAQAQSNNGDPLSLKIANAISPDRFFVRAGVIGVKIKTESEDTYDVTGPVLTQQDVARLISPTNDTLAKYISDNLKLDGNAITLATARTVVGGSSAQTGALKGDQGLKLLYNAMVNNNIKQIGTPVGIKAIAAESAGTAGLSLGYFLDDEYKWTVEAYVLAAPLNTYVLGSGPTTTRTSGLFDFEHERPFGLEGKKLITTKLLPPTVMLGRYWGAKDAKFRPYTGLLAMYAIFYDTKASDELNNYVGGTNPGDTTVKLKNSFGVGPMLGVKYQFSDQWHINFNLGNVKLKTEGTIVTRNTMVNNKTPAIEDLPFLSDAINSGETNYGVNGNFGGGLVRIITQNAEVGGLTGLVNKALAYEKGNQDLGTFVRKAKSTLTNTIFMLSVGRSF